MNLEYLTVLFLNYDYFRKNTWKGKCAETLRFLKYFNNAFKWNPYSLLFKKISKFS